MCSIRERRNNSGIEFSRNRTSRGMMGQKNISNAAFSYLLLVRTCADAVVLETKEVWEKWGAILGSFGATLQDFE